MNILELEKKYFLNVYKRFPVDIKKGKGVYLYDKNGNAYLDFLAGIAVNSLGYNHPAIISAIQKQINKNLHLSNYFVQDIQIELAKRILNLTPFSKLFYTNSGTEAIEGLLKLTKKWGMLNKKEKIIAFNSSFHGRSLGSLSITIQDKYQKNFFPLLDNIVSVPFNNAAALEKAIDGNTAAVFYEGITGEGGVKPVSADIYEVLNNYRKKYNFLIIADEIQTGIGRTGKFYYFEHCPIIPDAIATAKCLGGGLPLGAFLVNEKLTDIFELGEHGTTFGGNPLACSVGLATVEIISDKTFLKNVDELGLYFKKKLSEIIQEFKEIAIEVRGTGLMLGLQVLRDAPKIMMEAFQQGLILNIAGGNTLRFLPPLIINKDHIDEACVKLKKTIKLILEKN